MSDWLNGDLKKREVVITRPIEQIEELYKEVPENAIITGEHQSLTTVKVKYVLTNDLTPERIKELNKSVRPIKLDRKNKQLNNTKQKEKRIKCIDTVMAVVNIADFHLNRNGLECRLYVEYLRACNSRSSNRHQSVGLLKYFGIGVTT